MPINDSIIKQDYTGAARLVAEATAILESAEWFKLPKPEKQSVVLYPTVRQVRYFEKEGLIQQPSKRKRNAPVYERLHLLTLLVIKKLQAQNLPIRLIGRLIKNRSEFDLDRLLHEEITIFTDRLSLNQHIQSGRQKPGEEVLEIHGAESRNEYLATESRGHVSTTTVDGLEKLKATQDLTETWNRITITDGLELHVNERFRTPCSNDECLELLQALEGALANIKKLRR